MTDDLQRREPSPDLRVAARATRDLYAALIQEGLDDRQALVIVGQVIAAAGGGGRS